MQVHYNLLKSACIKFLFAFLVERNFQNCMPPAHLDSDSMLLIFLLVAIVVLMDEDERKKIHKRRRSGSTPGREQVRDRGRTGFDAALNEQMSFRLFFEKSYRLWDRYPSEFRELFRMDRSTFDRLAEILTPYLPKPKRRNRRDSIHPVRAVAI